MVTRAETADVVLAVKAIANSLVFPGCRVGLGAFRVTAKSVVSPRSWGVLNVAGALPLLVTRRVNWMDWPTPFEETLSVAPFEILCAVEPR